MRIAGAHASLRGGLLGDDTVGATNHYFEYHTDPRKYPSTDKPGTSDGVCNGDVPSFSSLWRFQAGSGYLNAEARSQPGRVGQANMIRLLQLMVEGETEHSIITRPNDRAFDV